jgi:hypothetical protein
MRKELRRAMRIGRHDALPPPYILDDGPLNDSTLVRFDWVQTIGRSAHNRDMRSRIIAELQRRRKHYPDVPGTVFGDKKALETVFDTAYTSFRTKWKTQNESQSCATPASKPTKPPKAGKVSTRQRRQARKKAVRLISHSNPAGTDFHPSGSRNAKMPVRYSAMMPSLMPDWTPRFR